MPDASSPRDGMQDVDLSTTVVVALGNRAPTKADDHRALADLVTRLTGVAAASVSIGQVCPNCGQSGHGPLRVDLGDEADAALTVHVSLARAAGRLALAVTAAGPVGIDLESVAALARAPLDDVLLSAAEADAVAALQPRAATAAVAAIWTAKEAVLKAATVGLRVDPRDLTITRETPVAPEIAPAADPAPDAAHPRLMDWPNAPFPLNELHLLLVATPPEFAGTVAVVCTRRPLLRFLPHSA
ncbi:4'-phosphopantetheinyl transferase superfamily protein [Cryobacterium adonitolivorans]|uniref:4'-phosphopantetheinyl transferase superfamily protein n=1 Tax=Cryobacterium adonitolivorans TaxID=1259189 RepID=A0A4R8WA37_9MICO|nr:4'-phosphopantetheinyl transferase superfamily protein [Cryobacterium adonitolivorans]TFC04757.1 4'-phosphopantetheinyl transferase superfamily protein [Cryobacterium adonitolivorans]